MLPQASDLRIEKPSRNAIPMPKDNKFHTNKRQTDDLPRENDKFGDTGFIWKEFQLYDLPKNSAQVPVDFSKQDQFWYYMGKKSTEAKAQFTEDIVNKPRFNPKGHFLETLPKPAYPMAISTPRQSYPASHPNQNTLNTIRIRPQQQPISASANRSDKPYNYKPRIPAGIAVDPQSLQQQRVHLSNALAAAIPYGRGINTTPQVWKSTLNSVNFLPPSKREQPSSFSGSLVGRTISHSPFGGRAAHGTPKNNTGRQTSSTDRFSKHPNPFARYAYLQWQHNKSPLEYKSPYMPNGGFMNGYQGSLVKHLQSTPNALSKYTSDAANRKSSSPSLLNNYKSHNLPPSKSLLSRYPEVYSSSSDSYSNSNAISYGPRSNTHTSSPAQSSPLHSTASPVFTPSNYNGYGSRGGHLQSPGLLPMTQTNLGNSWERRDPPTMHPAIRKEYMFHNQYQAPQPLQPQPISHNLPQPKPDTLYQTYKPQNFQPEMSKQFQAAKQPVMQSYQFQHIQQPIKQTELPLPKYLPKEDPVCPQPELSVEHFQPAKQSTPIAQQQNSFLSSQSFGNGMLTQQEQKPAPIPPKYEIPAPKLQYPHQQFFQKPHQSSSDYAVSIPEVTKPQQETFQQLPPIQQLAPMLQQPSSQYQDEPIAKIAECPPDVSNYVSHLMANLRKVAQ